ncbi:MAG: phosphoribosyl-AMP cyclohydrolase [Pseudomonadota bacterium]
MPETPDSIEETSSLTPRYDAQGLITAVVQDHVDGEILMLAHMNAEALEKTIETGFGHFWSRSRKALWRKGETSGNTLDVKEILIDCDQDAVILKVSLNGKGACHTGVRSCFYRKVSSTGTETRLVKQS